MFCVTLHCVLSCAILCHSSHYLTPRYGNLVPLINTNHNLITTCNYTFTCFHFTFCLFQTISLRPLVIFLYKARLTLPKLSSTCKLSIAQENTKIPRSLIVNNDKEDWPIQSEIMTRFTSASPVDHTVCVICCVTTKRVICYTYHTESQMWFCACICDHIGLCWHAQPNHSPCLTENYICLSNCRMLNKDRPHSVIIKMTDSYHEAPQCHNKDDRLVSQGQFVTIRWTP